MEERPGEERRLVTILFADLVGSTSLGEQLEPDELYELTDRAHRLVEACAQRYGGHVARHLGDGMMVLFGAPVAHENDAERAVLAGLEMQRSLAGMREGTGDGAALGMRIGITSGEVVTATMAGIYDVIGDAANVAARLQGAAQVGGVLVGEETVRLTRRRIRYGGPQLLTLKGKAEPVPAFTVLDVREQVGERWESGEGRGYAIPLLGREAELETLLSLWKRAQTGDGQLLSVVGESGVGKSRLVAEVVERILAGGHARVLRGRCLSYGQSVSLWLIADLLRGLCGVREDAGPDEVQQQVTSTVEALLAGCDDTDRAIACDVLGEILGLPPGGSLVAHAGPQVRRQSLVRILRLVLSALARQGPLLLVLEDLHWLDTASGEILAQLLLDVPGKQMLVLAAQRPGWTPPWSEWGWTERLTLRPLADEEAALLAGAVLGGMELSAELKEHIRERAGGNPFFVEELLRFLQETGGLEQRNGRIGLVPGRGEKLPSTLTEVLLARLDRLEGQVKAVAQVASVIGRSFAVRLLSRVMEREETLLDAPLRALQQAEIAFPRGGGDPEYVFKHVTARDVAYGMLVRKRQRQLHLQVARAIAQLYPSDEYVEMIAYHYARTEEDAEAAEWLEKAGNRARDAYALEAAIEHYRAALDRLERIGAEAGRMARIEVELGGVLQQMGRYTEAEVVCERALERYREAGDPEGMGRAAYQLGFSLVDQGRLDKARQVLVDVATVLHERGPSPATASLHHALTLLLQHQGRWAEMVAVAERMEEMARAVGDVRLQGIAEERRGTALPLMALGRIEEGRAALERAIPLLEEAGDLVFLGTAVANLGETRRVAGDLAEALGLAQRALELAVRTGFVRNEMIYHLNLAQILMATGEWQRAREHIERAEEIAAGREVAVWVAAVFPIQRGELALREGDWEGAREHLERAVDLSSGATQEILEYARVFLAELAILEGRSEEAREGLEALLEVGVANLPLVLPVLAWAYLELGETEEGLKLAEQAVQETRERQMLLCLPEALRMKGMALARLGRHPEALKVLDEARDRAAAMPIRFTEARILVELGLLDWHQGQGDRAREQLQEALAIFQRLGARKDVERTAETLAALNRHDAARPAAAAAQEPLRGRSSQHTGALRQE